MNYLWAFMILSGVIFSAFHGTIPAVTGAVLDSAKEAVTLCITMTGVMSFWMGLMRIAERGGVIAGLSRKLKPVLIFLFQNMLLLFSSLPGLLHTHLLNLHEILLYQQYINYD